MASVICPQAKDARLAVNGGEGGVGKGVNLRAHCSMAPVASSVNASVTDSGLYAQELRCVGVHGD